MKTPGTLLTAIWLFALVYFGRDLPLLAGPHSRRTLAAAQAGTTHRLAESLQHKIDHIRDNSERTHPDPAPTVMTEDEVNDYLASDKVQLPQGVKKVTLQGRSGVVDGFVNVDFDEIRGGARVPTPPPSHFLTPPPVPSETQ